MPQYDTKKVFEILALLDIICIQEKSDSNFANTPKLAIQDVVIYNFGI